jgi:hypothetical protein
MQDITTSVDSALNWASLASTGLTSSDLKSQAIQTAAGLIIDNNMDASGIFILYKF